MQNIRTRSFRPAFSLPTVLIISLTVLTMCLASLQTVTFLQVNIQTNYYQRLAREAAEAGLAHASSCLAVSNHTQTWGSSGSGDLQPNTDCNGANISGQSIYVYQNAQFQTAYDVGNLDNAQTYAVQISSTGTASVLSSGKVVQTYTATMKQVITWDPSLKPQQSASGYNRTCAILSYSAYCWGDNTSGALGNNSTTDSLTPVSVERDPYPTGIGSHNVIDIASGAESACMLIDTGEVYCWGANTYGELGNGTTTSSYVPTAVTGLSGKNITAIGSAGFSYCAVVSNGDLYCWGMDNYGQVGNNTTTASVPTPVLVGGPSGGYGALSGKVVTAISPNSPYYSYFICALSGGKPYCWGSNLQGQIGTNTLSTTKYLVPTAVYTGGALSGKTVTAISADGQTATDTGKSGTAATGNSAVCVVAYTSTPSDAKAYCWGSNQLGELGNNGTIGTSGNTYPAWIYSAPVAVYTGGVLSGKTVTEVAVSDRNACAIAYTTSISNARAYCWGAVYSRGDGNSGTTAVPVAVTDTYSPSVFANNQISNITGGSHRMCAAAQGQLYCWGRNSQGQIGDGTTVDRLQPTLSLFLRPETSNFIY